MNNQHFNIFTHKKKRRYFFLLFSGIFITVFIVSLFIGRYNISVLKVINNILSGKPVFTETEAIIFFSTRLPRIIIVSFIGMALSISGTVYQGLFRNPLVSPNILGVSAGCSFGAALGIIAPFTFPYSIELFAFIFGLVAVMVTYGMSYLSKRSPVLILILSGIIVSSFFNSMLSFLKHIADVDSELPSIVYWIMGGFHEITWKETIMTGTIILPIVVVMLLLSTQLNILSLGDDDAKSLGVNVKTLRKVLILLTTLMVAISVSISGSIAWIGLVTPHITRSFVGSNHRLTIPVSLFVGAISLLIADDIARSITTSEVPIGIIISFIGAPLFAYLLLKTKNNRGFRDN